MLIDTHAHLYWDVFKSDLEQVLQGAKEAGVTTIINVGVNPKLSAEALKQAEEIKELTVYSTIGIHPHEALRLASLAQGKPSDVNVSIHEDCTRLEEIYLKNPDKVVAVGECGLDYVEVDEPVKQLQRQLFQAQIELAKKLNLPIIVHCRDDRSQNPTNSDCWNDVLAMVAGSRGILHCYSGLEKMTKRLMTNEFTNFLVSFAATITYPKNDYLIEAVKALPLERICLETDSPFLPPQSKRGQRNEPSAVLEIAQLIAQIKGASVEQVASQTTTNVQRLFKLN